MFYSQDSMFYVSERFKYFSETTFEKDRLSVVAPFNILLKTTHMTTCQQTIPRPSPHNTVSNIFKHSPSLHPLLTDYSMNQLTIIPHIYVARANCEILELQNWHHGSKYLVHWYLHLILNKNNHLEFSEHQNLFSSFQQNSSIYLFSFLLVFSCFQVSVRFFSLITFTSAKTVGSI